MKIPSSSTPLPSPTASTSVSPRLGSENNSGLPSLVPGQLLHARVLASGPNNIATLEVGGQKFMARSYVPLEVGREFWMEVRDPGPPPWISPAEQKGFGQELFRFLIEARQAGSMVMPHLEALQELTARQGGQVFPELTRLISLLGSLALDNSPAPERVALLLAWIESGRRGEKPAFPTPLAQELSTLVTALEQRGTLPRDEAGEHLESLQKSAKLLHCLAEGNGTLGERQEWFLCPCIFAEAAGWGECFVELPNRGRQDGGEGDFTLSFFLNMSRLGEVALQVTGGKQALHGTFKVGSEEARQHLAAGIPELAQALESLGFQPVQLSSVMAPINYVRDLREKLTDKTAGQTFSLFSVRV